MLDRSLLTWSIPNMITIWLMVLGLIVVYALGAQLAAYAGIGNSPAANNSGGY